MPQCVYSRVCNRLNGVVSSTTDELDIAVAYSTDSLFHLSESRHAKNLLFVSYHECSDRGGRTGAAHATVIIVILVVCLSHFAKRGGMSSGRSGRRRSNRSLEYLPRVTLLLRIGGRREPETRRGEPVARRVRT